MRTAIKWAELHSPLFLAGTNLQQKLDPTKRAGLVMEFDEHNHQLYVTYNGQTARVPEPSILSMIEGTIAPREIPKVVIPSGKAVKAQASGPTDHVFAGPGMGEHSPQAQAALRAGKMKF